jgi:uncharacterized protein YqjF (DUF2071 family)
VAFGCLVLGRVAVFNYLWEGKCYISLIGFMLVKTKLLGIKIPLYVNFEEVLIVVL